MMRYQELLRLSFLAGAVGLLAGCNVGPKYVRPNVTAPPAFRGADDAAITSDVKNSFGDEQWAAVYREPELQELIRKALANNYDVRIAAQRILEQQAQVRITRSQEFPTVTVGGTGIGASLPTSLGTQLPNPLVDGSLNVSAAWTPDFWGLYRKQTEAARAQLLAQVWAQRAVRLTLVQQVATAYLQIRALDAQLEITKRNSEGPAGLGRPHQETGEWRFGAPVRCPASGAIALHSDLGDTPARRADSTTGECNCPAARRKPRTDHSRRPQCACASASGSSHRVAFTASRAAARYPAG